MIKIALAQINAVVGDIKGNTGKIVEYCLKASSKGADIAVFPEMSLTGYPPEDLLFRDDFIASSKNALRLIAKAVNVPYVVVGLPVKRSVYLYNAAALISRDGISFHFKNALPNYGVFDEKRYFSAGNEFLSFHIKGKCLVLSICEDIWDKEAISAIKDIRPDILMNLSASPFFAGRIRQRVSHIRSVAKKVGADVVYVNLVGGQDELIFDGGSMVVSGKGLLHISPQFKESISFVSLPGRKRPKPVDFMPLAEEVYEALKLSLRDYVIKNGFSSVVLGLSGGIDSALTAAIAADSLGRKNVMALIMPSRFSSDETQLDAESLAKRLGIRYYRIPISRIYDTFIQSLAPIFRDMPFNVAEENIQARIRGTLLMAVSNKFASLLITTGNKSEMSVGYCTLYGDMAGGFALLKDVPKTLVYRLSRFYNRKFPSRAIPESILKRAPSAELREGQKDEDSLVPYSELDALIEAYVERHNPKKDVVSLFSSQSMAEKMIRLIDRNEYKRRQSPPGPKITPMAFGKDWRMPITKQVRLIH